ncbi:major facilitator superfamily domain-containing protein [Mycena belliarum]|uniref:Major facilitator superfamily domain-containing protein n=1 Tax=Mycena belliarum TaxID=1033014 RepID=A0AAD6UNE0_9AGAR|nr:major facilitator superfamily domain-containing protein [Mycena belliae]
MTLFNPFRRVAKDEEAKATQHVRTSEERSLVIRLDCFLMVFGCVSQVIKYLDQQNINQAYVSGMKEDLNLNGNELNYFTTYFNIGYCIMLVPSQIIMTYVRPSYWLSGLELIWGLLTGLIATAHTAQQIYVLRAFIGVCESSAWPGMMTLFMHWYTPTELAKRMGFYHSCQAIGGMMANALQTAMHTKMNGKGGLAGWRWMFILNSIMTVAVGLFGFVFLPDYPNKPNPRAFWFTARHAEMAMERLKRYGRAEPKPVSWAGARRTFTVSWLFTTTMFELTDISQSWVVYFIAALYVSTVLASYGYSYFSLFLKSLKNADGSARWNISDINVIPIGGQAIQVVFVWIWALLSDVLHTRHWLIIAQAAIGLIPCIIMSVWSVPLSAKYFSYFISYIVLGTAPLIFAWVSDIIPHDPEQRSLVVGVAIAMYYAVSAWSQVLVWPAKQAPHYKYGWQTSIALWILVITMTFALRYIDMKYIIPRRLALIKAEEQRTRSVEAGSSSVVKTNADESYAER